MERRTNVDAEPCFLPLFMLFGLGASGNQAAGRPYGRGGGFGAGVPPYGRGMGMGMQPYGQGMGSPYGANTMPGAGGFGRPGFGAPGMSPYGAPSQVRPNGSGFGGGANRWPMIF